LLVDWGQNSYGAAHGNDPANWQQNIREYCQDSTIDIIPMAFVTQFFGTGGLPVINLANVRTMQIFQTPSRTFHKRPLSHIFFSLSFFVSHLDL
jgi:hypothetical protein